MYSNQNSKINIILSSQKDSCIIEIIDNGKGIPKKDWKNIFRPGFSTKKAGWGLGLSLANRIIEDIHKKYFESGADIVETNTFNANSISQSDYKLEDYVYKLNFENLYLDYLSGLKPF